MTWTASPTQGAWLYDLGPIDYLPDPPLPSILPPIGVCGELDYYVTGDTLEDFAAVFYGDIYQRAWDAYAYWVDDAGTIAYRSAKLGIEMTAGPWRLIVAFYPPDYTVKPTDPEPAYSPSSFAPTASPPPAVTETNVWYRSWVNNAWMGLVSLVARRVPPSPNYTVMPPPTEFRQMTYRLTGRSFQDAVSRYVGYEYEAISSWQSDGRLYSYLRNRLPEATALPQSVIVTVSGDAPGRYWYDLPPQGTPAEHYSLRAGTTLEFNPYESGSHQTGEVALLSADKLTTTLALSGWKFPLTVRDPDMPVYSFERFIQLMFNGDYTAVRNGRIWAANAALNPGWTIRWGRWRGFTYSPRAAPFTTAREQLATTDPGSGPLLAGASGYGHFNGDDQDEFIVLQASVVGVVGPLQDQSLQLMIAWDEI